MIPGSLQAPVIFWFGVSAGLVESITPANPVVLHKDDVSSLSALLRLFVRLGNLLVYLQKFLRFFEAGLWIWAIFFSAVAFWKVLIIGLIGVFIGMEFLGTILGFLFKFIFRMFGSEIENPDPDISVVLTAIAIILPFLITLLVSLYMGIMAIWIFRQ